MNYKELINITVPGNGIIGYIPNVIKCDSSLYIRDNYKSLFVYNFLSDKEAICGYRNSLRDIYNIESFDDGDWLCLKNDNKTEKIASLNDFVSVFGIVGYIKDNKVYDEYFSQGSFYKNQLVYFKTKDLSEEEINKLPLRDRICYIPEFSFEGKEYIELNEDELVDGEDYYTAISIRKDIENYFGEDIINELSEKNIKDMVDDVFYAVDWQHPSSLIGQEYLDSWVNEILMEKGLEIK